MASAVSSPLPTASSILPPQETSTQPTVPSAVPAARLHSLKSTKDSTDDLRQRKARGKSHTRQQSSSTRARDFRVGNIGNNGLLYLRPVKRVSQAATNPTNASLTVKSSARSGQTPTASDTVWRNSMASGTGTYRSTGRPGSAASISPPPLPRTPKGYSPGRKAPRKGKGARTGHSQTPPSHGTFKIVIDRTEPDDEASQLYNVPIPHYRLGAPHFTDKGSAVLHSSLNTGSPNIPSDAQASPGGAIATGHAPTSPSPLATRPASHDSVSEPPGLTFDRLSHPGTSSADVITSKLQDYQDDNIRERTPTNIYEARLSPDTGQILAASIPELIVRITSPNRLDYDLLSDFFLTYRLFISPHDLAARLIQRLQVSVRAGDRWSRIVRVRTFVALRHWILNYFVDDFVSDYDLRVQFCEMVNKLCQGLEHVNQQNVGDLRILDELKRCWRHTCALFWDVPMPPAGSYADQDILPGGSVGSRLPSPAEVQHHVTMQKDPSQYQQTQSTHASPESSREQVNRAGLDFAFNKTSELQASSSSDGSRSAPDLVDERESMQVVSCTIPATGKHSRQPSRGPRPVPARIRAKGTAKHSHAGCGPARKPQQHKRSASFSDALRDDRVPLPAQQMWEDMAPAASQEQVLPGTLIRGALLSPAAPYVEAVVPQTPMDAMPMEMSSNIPDIPMNDPADKASPWANPGVRRLIGSVRRALSVRQNAMPPVAGTFAERKTSMSSDMSAPFIAAPIGEPGVPKRKLVGGRTRLRVDLLAAEVSEAFKVAVREAGEAQYRLHEMSQQEDSANDTGLLQGPLMPNKMHSNVTLGSRSIVIMDDTNGQITPKVDGGFFGGIESDRGDVISPGGTVGSQRQDVPLFLDNLDTTTTTAASSQGPLVDTHSPAEVHALGVAPRGGQVISMDKLAASPPPSSNSRDTTDLSKPVTQTQDHLSAPLKNTDASSFSEDSITTGDPFQFEKAPAKQLRRVPGGDLRSKNHVHSLDENFQMDLARAPRRRSRSPAIPPRSSSANATHVLDPDGTTTTDPMPTTGLTVETASSKPLVGAAFEKEVAKLAQLPDQDEGGIECALRSLEGRGRQMLAEDDPPQGALLALAAQVHGLDTGELVTPRGSRTEQSVKRHHNDDQEVIEHSSVQEDEATHAQVEGHSKALSSADSEGSESSIPLLERGASQKPRKNKAPLCSPSIPYTAQLGRVDHTGTQQSLAWGRPENGRLTTASSTRSPKPRTESFLLDDNETLNSVAGIIPDAIKDKGRNNREVSSVFEDDADGPPDLENPSNTACEQTARHPSGQRSASVLDIPRPSNPIGRSPSVNNHTPVKSRSADDLLDVKDQTPLISSPAAAHLPYVLAYDSLLLAQQFTVIERDALCEVEWRDLIDLRWNQALPPHQSWVEFLKANENEPHGIVLRPGVDICISRFNLVVRWAKSEIVLTQDVFERAATITKYIHIAKHARRLRNWATMYQLTMALVGADISRLKNTWDQVLEKDRATLRVLEKLIMPTRNFHNLREEIESATATFSRDGEGGCIPFMGIYTHDLIYNAQKAKFVHASDDCADATCRGKAFNPQSQQRHYKGSPTLVNFERHHTAATIVKNLLRLIEASSKYAFQPVPEVASRCLWLGALSDAEIGRRSRELERPVPARIGEVLGRERLSQ